MSERLMLPPLLEHQHTPQQPLMIVRTRKMFMPAGADERGIEVTVPGEPALVEKFFRPPPQGAAQP